MTNPAYKILIIDDEPDIVEVLEYNLKKEGFSITTAQNGKEGIEIANKIQPHLIIMDIMMPEMDGIEAVEIMRSSENLKNTVIAFLSARSEDFTQIAALNAGGDDYMVKPVKMKLFVARVKALLNRVHKKNNESSPENTQNIIKHGDIEINKEKYTVIIEGKELNLPKKEFNLLLLLSSKPGKVFTRASIFSNVWGDSVIVSGRTIDVHIRKLREKIGGHHIYTIKGIGYKYIE